MSALLEVQVAAVRQLTPRVREFLLMPKTGTLPRFSAGSHVQLELPLGHRTLRNAYSLVGDPMDRDAYRIAVRLQDDSRGGSRHLHERVETGQAIRISPPANLFQLHTRARLHILIAGGIGITPFLAYVAELERRGAAFELHYAYRAGETDAYVEDLRSRLGDCLHEYDGTSGPRLNVEAVLSDRRVGAHVYACGPARLIDEVETRAAATGWPRRCVHSEVFAAPLAGAPFVADLVRSKRRVHVPEDQSLLEALESAGVDVPNMCRGGVCGQCATRHLGGAADHRDSFLSIEQRAEFVMPCVSRGCGSPLLLDL